MSGRFYVSLNLKLCPVRQINMWRCFLFFSLLSSLHSEPSEYFTTKVMPILKKKCVKCHGPKKQKGDLRLDTYENVMKGTPKKKVVIPGNPKKSSFFTSVMLPPDDEDSMPGKGQGKPLSTAQKKIFLQWIKTGAK